MKTACWFFIFLSVIHGYCQTVVTNIVEAHPDFRVVSGQLYNSRISRQWSQQLGIIRHVSNNLAIAQWLIPEVIITDPGVPGRSTRLGRMGAFVGRDPDYIPPTRKTIYHLGLFFSITNLPKSDLVIGNQSSWLAMPVNNFEFQGKPIRLYDVGFPHIVSVVKTNAPRRK